MAPEDVYELAWAGDPRISPDGTTVAFVITRVDREANDYRSAIYLGPADRSTPPRRLTSGEKQDSAPRWSPSGRELFYLNGSTLVAVPIQPGPGAALGVGVATRLFDGPFDVGANNFDVWPDGTSFVMVEADPGARHTQVDVVQNWAKDVAQLISSR